MSTGNLNNKSVQRAIRFTNEQYDKIEAARGDVSFAMYVKRSVQMRLDGGESTEFQRVAPVPTSKVSKSAKTTGEPRPRYKYFTPEGEFDNRGDAEEANGLKTYTLNKKCDAGIDGFRRELVG